jgi:hypothetical protein
VSTQSEEAFALLVVPDLKEIDYKLMLTELTLILQSSPPETNSG